MRCVIAKRAPRVSGHLLLLFGFAAPAWLLAEPASVPAVTVTSPATTGVVTESVALPESLPEPLPEPLNLEQALALADGGHPALEQARAHIQAARAHLDQAEASNDFQVGMTGSLRYVEPSKQAPDRSNADHSLVLSVSKELYDFGRSEAREQAARLVMDNTRHRYMAERNRRRLTAMRTFFDALLADMEFIRDNEAMAKGYIRWDRRRERRELGEVSDLEVLEYEEKYHVARKQRYASETRQRIARARLANALNSPGRLPGTLIKPELAALGRKLPEPEVLLAHARENNPVIKAARAALEAAGKRVELARAGRRPSLSGEFAAAEYSRSIGARDRYSIGLTLQVPLWSGGAVDAGIAASLADEREARAALEEAGMELEQDVLEIWRELSILRYERERAEAQNKYRELYLDRARANYELEVQTDLGDAMIKISEAQRALAKARFDTALAWAKLDALLGNDIANKIPEQALAPQAKAGTP